MLNVGIIGTGVMGTNHLRVLNQLEGVRVEAVVEADLNRRADVSRDHDVSLFNSVDEMLADLELSSSGTSKRSKKRLGICRIG